jgi:hypothetical protein
MLNSFAIFQGGITCVHIASRQGQTKVLRHMKDIGVNLCVQDKVGSAFNTSVN